MTVTGELAVILALVTANGLFAGAEIAILSVRKTRLVERAQRGEAAARGALELRDHPERFLATVQVGITVVSASAAAFGGASLARELIPFLQRLGLPARWAADVALAVVIALVSYLSLVLGELVPKSLALRYAERYALVAARPLGFAARVARPVVWLLTKSSNLVLRLFRDETSFSESRLSPDELEQLLDEACSAGTLDRHAGNIARRALGATRLSVDAVKVPRMDVVTLPADNLSATARAALRTRPHAVYPVVDTDLDSVIGVLAIRDVAASLDETGIDLRSRLHPPWFVPESRPALAVLDEMQRSGAPMALVVDEQGAVTGLVTLEDLLEEIVGEIVDPRRAEPVLVERQADGSYVVSGQLPIRDLNRLAAIELVDEPSVTTVGGLIAARYGRFPSVGTQVDLGPACAEVLEATSRRIVRARVRLLAPGRRQDG